MNKEKISKDRNMIEVGNMKNNFMKYVIDNWMKLAHISPLSK